MNNLCIICNQPFDTITTVGGITLNHCKLDNLYMCPSASEPFNYGPNYELHYHLYAQTEFAKKLHTERWNFVVKNAEPVSVLDFGCGVATFGEYAPNGVKMFSYDPYFKRDFSFVWNDGVDVVTFWDSLEHMRRIQLVPLLKTKYIAVSTPTLKNGKNILDWKHFRPDEHVWYFNREAIVKLFAKWGYKLVDESDFEIGLGREDIWSFCFKRL